MEKIKELALKIWNDPRLRATMFASIVPYLILAFITMSLSEPVATPFMRTALVYFTIFSTALAYWAPNWKRN